MKNKLSIYNLYFTYGNDLVIYNSMSNNYIKINNCTIEKLKTFVAQDDYYNSDLLDYGILTELNDCEEKLLCDSTYYSYINNNTLAITIITTRACNFRCQYCPQNHNGGFMEKEIYNRIYKFILKNITDYSKIKITLFGGEPTLAYNNYSDFLDKINDLCKFYKRKFEGVMISNGYLLNKELIKNLYKKNITQFQITLDGSKENHNSNRPFIDSTNTFDVIYENLLNILHSKELKNLSIAIRINCTKELIDNIDNWTYLYEPFSTDNRFLINLGVVQDRGGEYIKDFSGELISESDDIYFMAKNKLSNHIFYEDYINKNYFVCKDVSRGSYTIDVDGQIRSCSNIYTDNIIGYLNKFGSAVFDKRKDFLYLKNNSVCKGCVVEPLCHGKTCVLKTNCDKNSIIRTVESFIMKQSINTINL